MKRYRAEVWLCSEPNVRVYCSDWLDDVRDARVLKNDSLNDFRETAEEGERFQGIVRIEEERK